LPAREELLRQIEQELSGKAFLSEILHFTLEAMLSDPAYGGNINQKGWKWLEHQPGFPGPQVGKRYFEL